MENKKNGCNPNIKMSCNDYNKLNLVFSDKFKIIKDIFIFKDLILLSIIKKGGLYKVKYYPYKNFPFSFL